MQMLMSAFQVHVNTIAQILLEVISVLVTLGLPLLVLGVLVSMMLHIYHIHICIHIRIPHTGVCVYDMHQH